MELLHDGASSNSKQTAILCSLYDSACHGEHFFAKGVRCGEMCRCLDLHSDGTPGGP